MKGDRIKGVDNNKPEAATKSSTRADVPSDGNEEGGGKKERNHDEAQQPQDVEDKPAEDAPLSAVDFPPTASPADLVDRAMEATKQLFEGRIQEYGATREVFIKETNGFREELLEGVKVEAVKMITKLEARDYGQLKSVEERVVRNTQYEAAKKASFKKLEDEIKSSLYLPVRANELESRHEPRERRLVSPRERRPVLRRERRLVLPRVRSKGKGLVLPKGFSLVRPPVLPSTTCYNSEGDGYFLVI